MKNQNKKIMRSFSLIIKTEKRDSDDWMVVSPKGMAHHQWEVANKLAIFIRMLEREDEDNMTDSFVAAFLTTCPKRALRQGLLVHNTDSVQLVEKLRELFLTHRGMGFGEILEGCSHFINKQTNK